MTEKVIILLFLGTFFSEMHLISSLFLKKLIISAPPPRRGGGASGQNIYRWRVVALIYYIFNNMH